MMGGYYGCCSMQMDGLGMSREQEERALGV